MVTKEDLNALIDSIEILSNKNTMEQIDLSQKDIENNKCEEISSVNDLF